MTFYEKWKDFDAYFYFADKEYKITTDINVHILHDIRNRNTKSYNFSQYKIKSCLVGY